MLLAAAPVAVEQRATLELERSDLVDIRVLEAPSLDYEPDSVTLVEGTSISTLSPSSSTTGAVSFTVAPPLPAGLSLDGATGEISGTATQATAREFIVRTEGQDGYTLFTTLGENYLVVSGTGDIEAIRQVAWSLR